MAAVRTDEKRRMISVHLAHTVLVTDLSRTIIKAHILSGNDCLSKVGSKHAAIMLNPVQYLVNFADGILTDQDIALAERYLVRVWAGVRSTTTAETFDELRLEAYLKGTSVDCDKRSHTSWCLSYKQILQASGRQTI